MRITFLVPPVLEGKREVERVFGCTYGLYPIPNIFILYVASVLEQEGHQVRLVDAALERWSLQRWEEYLGKNDSQVFCLYTVNLAKKTDLDALGQMRSLKKETPVIFLGPAPTYYPEDFLVDEDTYVVRGEPELILPDLIRSLDHGNGNSPSDIAGVSFVRDKVITHNPSPGIIDDLDSLPFPARHLLNNKAKYYNPKLGKGLFTALLTSRGCSYNCRFCVPNSQSFARELEYKRYNQRKPPVRLRSPENIRQELALLKSQRYRSLAILDDQFIWGQKRTLEICQVLKGMGFKWGALVRADHLDKPVVQAISETHCCYLDIGIESFDQTILDEINKELDVAEALRAIRMLKNYRVPFKLNILLGASPNETQETIKNNIRMAKELGPEAVMFGICNPFPGTEFWELAQRGGYLIYDDYVPVNVQKHSTISYPNLTNKDLEKLVKKANIFFYLRPSFIFKNLIKAGSILTAWKALKSLYKKLRG